MTSTRPLHSSQSAWGEPIAGWKAGRELGRVRGAPRHLGWFLAVGLVIAATAAYAGPSLRHAGKVHRIDLTAGILIVDQLARHGKHERQVVHIADDTPVVTAQRPRFWDTFEEQDMTPLEVLVGDFVVVESAEHDGRLWARKITVVEPGRRPAQPSSRP